MSWGKWGIYGMKWFRWALAAALATLPIATPVVARSAPKVGEMAPDFDLTLIDGTHVRLSICAGR